MTGDIKTVLLSGIVGILLGGLVQAAVDRYAAFKEGKGIAVAIRAELEALLKVWDRANWREEIKEIIERLEIADNKLTPDDFFTFDVNPKPFQVFDSLCHKVWLLGDLSAQIVGVYVLGKAFNTNVGTLRDHRDKVRAKQGPFIEREDLLEFTHRITGRLQEFQAAASKTVSALATFDHRRWLWVFP